ncbi:tetratricopeptide repeat protein [Streptomyces sp. NPDC051207]|uniref:tetratricopeptide repeat protein n=1 Tax=Streptomyces sp. NPDC051207 TaxID=3154641 RepID=UPI00341D19CF
MRGGLTDPARHAPRGPAHPDRAEVCAERGLPFWIHPGRPGTRSRTRPSRHPHSRNYLAASLYALGRYQEAADLFGRNLADLERTLGPDHPDTLSSRNKPVSRGGSRRTGRRAVVDSAPPQP